MHMKSVVIEDNHEMRAAMVSRIKRVCPDVEVVGEAASVVEAAKVIKARKPDLLFLDIELPDGTGFDILDIIDGPVKVICTTASDSYAMRAFKYAAIDYLLKPIDEAELKLAVDRASEGAPVHETQVGILGEAIAGAAPQRIALHTSDKIIFVEVDEMVRCEADGNYTRFFVKEKSPILVARTLKEYDNLLTGKRFFRVHQSHLVNRDEVREFVKTDGGYLVMSDGTKVPVSTRRRQKVLDWLNDIPHP